MHNVKQPLWCALLRVHVPVLYEPHPLILQTCILIGDADEDQTIIAELSSTNLSDEYEAETDDFTTTTTTTTPA